MKVAMIGHKRVPSHEGGIEVVVEELATRMVQQGHSVTCYNRSGQHVSGKEHTAERRSEYKERGPYQICANHRRQGLGSGDLQFFCLSGSCVGRL